MKIAFPLNSETLTPIFCLHVFASGVTQLARKLY